MTDAASRDAGYDEWLDAIADGTGFYLECPNGHGSLPPRRACPRCGAIDLAEVPLPQVGAVETFTVVHIPTPQFADDAPYVTAIADFGPVRVTGLLRGVELDAVAVGLSVSPTIEETATRGDRLLVFRPTDEP